MTELWLLFLLLPVAALSGWWLALRHGRKVSGRRTSQLSSNYFRGLNYLLSEQPDKAIEVFLELAEVNRETVETHLALGNLFRRRGEVDKAIRCHQHIISRPHLTDEQRTGALMELGEDYMRAGLLDRAEGLFSKLVDDSDHAETALRHLLVIYQQEQDWEKAIEQALRLERVTGEPSGLMVAQFHCELAQGAVAAGDEALARRHLRQARRYNPACARAYVLEAELARDAGELEAAIAAYRQACRLEPGCFPLVLDTLLECFDATDRMHDAEQWLASVVEQGGGVSAVLALARLVQRREGAGAAARFLLERLQVRPSVRGLELLAELTVGRRDSLAEVRPELVRELLQRLLEGQPRYRCQHCGFSGQIYHWQCPSCRRWETTRPIAGVMGE